MRARRLAERGGYVHVIVRCAWRHFNMRIIRHHLVATVLCLVSTILSADEVRLTTDGKVKRDPVFFKPDGSELLFAQLDKPNQLRLMKLDLRDRSVTPLHPDETRSEF